MKKSFFPAVALWGVLFLTGCVSSPVYVGGNDGIHHVRYSFFSSNWRAEKVTDISNVSFMAAHRRSLYAARRIAREVYCVDVFRIRRDGSLNKTDAFVIPGKHGYCHISLSGDGKYLFGSSYSGGFLDVLSLIPGGGIIRLKQRIPFVGRSIHKRQKGSHPHFAAETPDGTKVLAADLGCDRIYILKNVPGKGFVQTGSAVLPPGAGPRHLSFSADGKFVFCANELNNTVTSFKLEKEELVPVDSCRLLPAAWSGRSFAGAVKTSPSGEIFVTNRGHDSVAVLSASSGGKLKYGNVFSSMGNFPYDILLRGRELFTVCMKSDKFGVWKRKDGSWELEETLTIRRPVCIIPVPEK